MYGVLMGFLGRKGGRKKGCKTTEFPMGPNFGPNAKIEFLADPFRVEKSRFSRN